MSDSDTDPDRAEDRERNRERMREYREEVGRELSEEPVVLPRLATTVAQGDLYAGCSKGTFNEANTLTYEVAEHMGCALAHRREYRAIRHSRPTGLLHVPGMYPSW